MSEPKAKSVPRRKRRTVHGLHDKWAMQEIHVLKDGEKPQPRVENPFDADWRDK